MVLRAWIRLGDTCMKKLLPPLFLLPVHSLLCLLSVQYTSRDYADVLAYAATPTRDGGLQGQQRYGEGGFLLF